MEKLFKGEDNFYEGAQDLLALFEKTMKKQYEKFFLLKLRSNIKNEQKLLRI